MVGSFVFLDQQGAQSLLRGDGVDVQPHPHSGPAAVTGLSRGALLPTEQDNAARIVAGSFYGLRSPAQVLAGLFQVVTRSADRCAGRG